MGKVKLRFIRGYACGHTQVKNVPHRILTYNRLPPDLYKCGGNFSLGHSLQTMDKVGRENEITVRNKLRKLLTLAFSPQFPIAPAK